MQVNCFAQQTAGATASPLTASHSEGFFPLELLTLTKENSDLNIIWLNKKLIIHTTQYFNMSELKTLLKECIFNLNNELLQIGENLEVKLSAINA